jgi:hypothetical protein
MASPLLSQGYDQCMSNIEREVEFGLEQFAPERKIEVPLRDLLYAYKTIGEFIQFFHDPHHFRTLADVQRFLGNRHEGGLHVLWETYYRRLRDAWPRMFAKRSMTACLTEILSLTHSRMLRSA